MICVYSRTVYIRRQVICRIKTTKNDYFLLGAMSDYGSAKVIGIRICNSAIYIIH